MVNAQQHRIENSFEAERKGLFAFIRSKIRSLEESEDLLQDIYVQALGNLNVLDSVDNLTGWLYTVAKNKVIDWYRKKRIQAVSIDEVDENGRDFKEFLTAEIPEGLDENELDEIYQIIFRHIEELPEKQQYVFIQQVVEGRTFRELAAETGESINTLIARKQYAIKFLKNKLKNLFNE